MFSYRSIPVNPLLRDIVLRCVIFEGKIPEGVMFSQDVIPSLSEFITFNLNSQPQYFKVQDKLLCLKDCFVTGLHSQPYEGILRGDIKLIGVQIKPPGLAKLFNLPMHYMTNNALLLCDIIGQEADIISQQMMEGNSIEKAILRMESFLIEKFTRSKLYHHNPLYFILLK